jgi:hypothetical protein
MAPSILISATDANEWSASRSNIFTPRYRALGSQRKEDSLGPTVSVEAVEERNVFLSKNRNPAVPPLPRRYTN